MEQDKLTEYSEPVSGVPYTPNTPLAPADTSAAQPLTLNTNPITINTQSAAPVSQPAKQNIQTETHGSQAEAHPAKRIVGVIFSTVEVILALRLIFKLLGANHDNGFVQIINDITHFFVGLFSGIFQTITVNADANAVFEPASLIAMAVVALVALAILTLMTPHTGSRVVRSEFSGPSDSAGSQK